MVHKINYKNFLISIFIPIGVGGLSALITRKNMDLYSKISVPILSPPDWIFPIVWTILYLLMGISLYIVVDSKVAKFKKNQAIIVFAIQLLLNFIWSPLFFYYKQFLWCFIILVVMFALVFVMTILFYNISKTAGIIQIPYLMWIVFAGYLNFSIYLIN